MNLNIFLKRLPFALIIWGIGAVTCGFALLAVYNSAANMSATVFNLLSTYIPYIVMTVCTIVTLVGSDQSFASWVYSIVFSLIMAIVCMVVINGWQCDEAFAAILLANSEDGMIVQPLTEQPMRMGLRALVSIMIPLIVGMVCSWAVKRGRPEPAKKGKQSKKNKGK
ncbi:MAG: hypothetical protein Q4E12_01815 [Coriobacteriia bacterium]|nr:hypothetical protein [Coriobacteriia bacterium]